MASDGGAKKPHFTSPLTGGHCDLIRTIRAAHIVDLYQDEYQIDVTPYLGTDEIELFRCNDTGYEFFLPFSAEGPPAFYSDLYSNDRNTDWTYQATKWEYSAAAAHVPNHCSLLDIGCGGGDFLLYIKDKCDPLGLETSPFGLQSTREKGMAAVAQTIEDHAKDKAGTYDVVVAFQVLEHITDVRGFLDAAFQVLVPGGHLIIAVPNNDSFIGGEDNLTLNMPPHHMGRWGRDSLKSLASVFEVDLVSIEYEPLQTHNFNWYQSVMEAKYLPSARWKRSLFYRFGFNEMFRSFVAEQSQTILGHTIMAVYKKKLTVTPSP